MFAVCFGWFCLSFGAPNRTSGLCQSQATLFEMIERNQTYICDVVQCGPFSALDIMY